MATQSESYEVVLRARDELTRILKAIGPETAKSTSEAARGVARFAQSLREGEGGARRFGSVVGGVFSSLGRGIRSFLRPGIGQIAILLGSVAGLSGAVRGASAFSQAMSEVGTIVDTTTVSMEALRDGVLDTAKALGLSELNQAKALYQAISAGVAAGADSLLFLGEASKLAVAGVSDTASTVDLLTNVLNAYRLEVSETTRVSDALFETVRLGKTTISELASGLSVAIPLASQLGIDIEELGAAVATITAGGGGTTSEAATQIAAVLRSLLTNFEQIQEAVRAAGGEFDIASIKSDGLAATLQRIRDAAGGSEERIIELVTRAEALNAVLNLTGGNLERFVANIGDVRDSAGATERALKTQMEDPAKRLGIVFNALRIAFQTTFGRSLIEAAARAIDFAGGVAGVEAQVKLLGTTLGAFAGSAIEGFGRLIAKVAEFQESLGGTERIGRIATAAARLAATSVQLGIFQVIESVQNLIKVIARLPAAIRSVLSDLPEDILGFDVNLFRKSRGELEEEIVGLEEFVGRARQDLEEQMAALADAARLPGPDIGALSEAIDFAETEMERLRALLDTAPERPEGVLAELTAFADPSSTLAALRAQVAEEAAALRDIFRDAGKDSGDAFESELRDAFAAAFPATLPPLEVPVEIVIPEGIREAFEAAFPGPPEIAPTPEQLARLREAQDALFELQRATAQTSEERLDIARQEAASRREAIEVELERRDLTFQEIDALREMLTLSDRLAQTDLGAVLDFESFSAEVERFRSELTLTVDEQKEAIDRWADSERERLELLRIEGQLTDEQIARLDALIERLSDERKAKADGTDASEDFARSQVSVADAIGQNTEAALARMIAQLDFGKDAFKSFADSVLQDLLRIAIRQAITGPLFGLPTPGFSLFEHGGVALGGLSHVRQLATGGIARGGVDQAVRVGRAAAQYSGMPFKAAQFGDIFRGPHLALIGEGKQDEAVVPLEGNRSIPVEFRGGDSGGGGVTIVEGDTYHIQAIDVKSFEDRLKASHRVVGEIGLSKVRNDSRTRREIRAASRGIG